MPDDITFSCTVTTPLCSMCSGSSSHTREHRRTPRPLRSASNPQRRSAVRRTASRVSRTEDASVPCGETPSCVHLIDCCCHQRSKSAKRIVIGRLSCSYTPKLLPVSSSTSRTLLRARYPRGQRHAITVEFRQLQGPPLIRHTNGILDTLNNSGKGCVGTRQHLEIVPRSCNQPRG